MSRMHRDRVKADPVKKQGLVRTAVQLGFAVFFNGWAAGFFRAKIFTGKTKGVCVPVLNCYSCPGALGACPIGSLQAILGGADRRVPFYVLGTLTLFGVILGRLACGFLCPFGFLQDILSKIPVKKLRLPKMLDKALRYVKYLILLVFVLLLPTFLVDKYGAGAPWFCKYICPAGTLEGGVPLLIGNETLRALAGWLFSWKALVLLIVLVGAIWIPRFFCRYLCPLGAIYGLFNRFSLARMALDKEKCVNCGKCEQVCPMAVDVRKDINTAECIRCGKCKAACPANAIRRDPLVKKSAAKTENAGGETE